MNWKPGNPNPRGRVRSPELAIRTLCELYGLDGQSHVNPFWKARNYRTKFLVLLLVFSAWLVASSVAVAQQSVYFEAENFQFTGDWTVESGSGAFGTGDLLTTGSAANDATTAIPIPTSGTYNIWVRARDFDTYPGMRLFQAGIDGVLLGGTAGATGTNGWLWQNVGARTLTASTHVFTIHDVSHFYPRCDALFLTTGATDPNTLTATQLAAFTIANSPVSYRSLDCPSGITVRFMSASDVSTNIRPLLNGPMLAYNATDGGVLRFSATSSAIATALFDTTAADGTATTNKFTNPTITVDVRFGGPQMSFGLFTRVPTAENNSHLALVNCDNSGLGSSEMYRFYVAGIDPNNGNAVGITTLLSDVSNDLTVGTWYTFRLTVNNNGGGSATFTLQILNRTTGASVITKTATAASGALTSAGEIGFRFYSQLAGAGQVIDLDNVSVVENPPCLQSAAARTATATITGSTTSFTFYSQPDVNGGTQITRDTELLIGGAWTKVPVTLSAERLFMLYRSAVTADLTLFYPRWTQKVDFDIAGTVYPTALFSEDPSIAGEADTLIARSCQQVDSQTVGIAYQSLAGRAATATWQLGAGGCDLKVSLSMIADRAGEYSFGFAGFESTNKTQTAFHLLPPLYQFQRLPSTPLMITSSITPQPLALVEKTYTGLSAPVSLAVAADPSSMPFAWPTASNAAYGFSLLNTDGSVQPAVYTPVLGLGSHLEVGGTGSATWHVLLSAGDWKQSLEYFSNYVFGVSDYRQPYSTSLTGAALNMIDLLRNDDSGGWDATLKGPYQIESGDTVTQASPLTFTSIALLAHDETFYQTRSLPTIEFTLSRPSAHFATDVTAITSPSYINTAATNITVPTSYYGTAYWQGVHDLLGRKNPWIGSLALNTNGTVRATGGVPTWLDELGQYRLSPSAALLQQVETDCQTWMSTEVYGTKTGEMSLGLFYHVSFYPYWWGLVDLYEVTANPIYLAAAEEGAFHTMAGVFSHPMPTTGNVTVHPGGVYPGTTSTIWWKGPVPYRLGYPRVTGDTPERSVPAWLVSPVGFSLEQPTTYYTGTGNPGNLALNMQMMAAWAPHLMRLYRYTGRDIYQTYARNAIIGRFGNDPGYYYRGFTDMFLDSQYPYAGPDVTSIYYHHIPARLAWVVDYLMAQAEAWSGGQISFPWVKQQGYVWFTNRSFGSQPGSLYGQSGAWPWLDRNAAQLDSTQVDYFLARSSSNFWVVMMNQSNSPVTVHLTTQSPQLGIIASQPVATFYNNQPAAGTMAFASPMAVTVPAKNLVAVRFVTQIQDVFPRTVALTGGTATQTLPSSWGTMYAFRTRSPFGSDSLSVVLTGRPAAGGTANLLLNGTAAIAKTAYPYEFSVYPWPMNQDMQFSLQLTTNGIATTSASVTLPGTTTSAPTAYDQWKTDSGLPANAPDSGDSDNDGLPNLMEYALNTNPLVADHPSPVVVTSGSGLLKLTYTKWRADVTYCVETSTDLVTWTSSGVDQGGDGLTVSASVPSGADARRFLRLRVTRP